VISASVNFANGAIVQTHGQ